MCDETGKVALVPKFAFSGLLPALENSPKTSSVGFLAGDAENEDNPEKLELVWFQAEVPEAVPLKSDHCVSAADDVRCVPVLVAPLFGTPLCWENAPLSPAWFGFIVSVRLNLVQ